MSVMVLTDNLMLLVIKLRDEMGSTCSIH